jgi:hypothetical protein
LGGESSSCYIELPLEPELITQERPTMHKRLAATAVLGIALLLSQGANVLVAALCPHLRSPSEPCITEAAKTDADHEHMDHTEMDSSEVESVSAEPSTFGEASKGVSLSQPVGACPHCAMHSRSSSNPASFREIETAKRANDINIPLAVVPVIHENESAVSVLTVRAHSPPGSELLRHVLINVYRI